MLLAQISDCHVTTGDDRVADRVDPTIGLRRAVELINSLPIDLVIATGDLVNDARPDEYDRLEALLAPVHPPVLPLPGNHDDRAELRTRSDAVPDGSADTPIDHVVDVGSCRIVCLDTTIPGRHDGRLTTDQLTWLDSTLAERPDVTTIVAQHHPPVPSGIPSMDDRFGLDGADGEAAIVARHRQVAAIVGGHYHRTLHSRFANTVAVACPSTALQLALDLDATDALYCDEPPAMMLHRVDPAIGSVTSYPVPLIPVDTWTPSWATTD